MGKSCAIDLRVAGSNPAGQLLIYFHNVFPVLTKTLCQHPSLAPRSHILESYMDWFPSLICKNYIFKHFVKIV